MEKASTQQQPPAQAAAACAVDDVIATADLFLRHPGQVDTSVLLDEVVSLSECLGSEPAQLLQRLVDAVLRLTRAGSAGLSLEDVDNGSAVFRWVATAGEFARYRGGTLPRYFSPCGTVVDQRQPALMRGPVRAFPYVSTMHLPLREVLLVPFNVNGRCVGTVWVVAHDDSKLFDATDLNVVQKLSAIAGAGVQAVKAAEALSQRQQEQAITLVRTQEVAVSLQRWFNQAPGFVALLRGRAHVFERVNPAYARLVGNRTLVGRSVEEALPETYAQGFGALLDGVFTTGTPHVGQDTHLLMENSPGTLTEIYLDVELQPVHDEAGAVVGILVQGHDVTRQHNAAQQLLDADRLKDEFVATLAHELRNPLAPIRQAVPIVRSPNATAAQRSWGLDVIERQVGNMALLLDDLLDVSQVARGRIALRPQAVSVRSLLEAAVEVARPVIDAKQHRLHLTLPLHSLCVMGDPLRLTQVFTNLLTNACRYTPAPGQIDVLLAVEADAVRVSVQDTGIGIDPSQQEAVFELFEQADKRLERGNSGLGLGLTLARQLVRLHGGALTLASEGLGRGSCFTVSLPRLTAPHLVPQVALPAACADSAPAPLSIVVADDNVDFALSLQAMLKPRGHAVEVVHDGQLALQTIQRQLPNVAILDVGMPGLNGYEVARRVRQGPVDAHLLLIAVSGWGQGSDKQLAAEAGFDHHLTKPIEIDQLVHLLEAQPPRAAAPVQSQNSG